MSVLVIFDCDGVLVDSESLAAEVFSHELQKIGIMVSPDECYAQFRGRSLSACFYSIEERFQKPLPENFQECIDISTRLKFEKALHAVKGVEGVLQLLESKNIPFCVASNGSHNKIQHSLKLTNLLSYFQGNRFSAEDVREGKPAPDLFLYAAENMGILSSQSYVIEDSLAGAQAGIAAGMKTLIYDMHGDFKASEALEVSVFRSMDELPSFLGIS